LRLRVSRSAPAAWPLLEGVLGGWMLRNQVPNAVANAAMAAGLSCVPLVLGMLFVQAVFRVRLVRTLFDVLAILIWLLLVGGIGELFTSGASALTGEGVYLAPFMSGGLTFVAVLVASLAGVILWLSARVKKTQ
jgi:hypothetical protein